MYPSLAPFVGILFALIGLVLGFTVERPGALFLTVIAILFAGWIALSLRAAREMKWWESPISAAALFIAMLWLAQLGIIKTGWFGIH